MDDRAESRGEEVDGKAAPSAALFPDEVWIGERRRCEGGRVTVYGEDPTLVAGGRGHGLSVITITERDRRVKEGRE